MAEEYQQPQLHRRHEAEEEGERREFYDESKSTTPFAYVTDKNNNVGSAAASARDEVATTEGPNDHGLFGFEEKKPTTNDINGDVLRDESAIEATDRGLFGHFTGKKEEDAKKVDEENEVANTKDRSLFGFEEKKPMVDDINGDILGDENVVKSTDRGLFGHFMEKKEEDVKKVDEKNDVANPKDRGLSGFEEKKPMVDDINGEILGDESVVKASDRGLFGQFTGKKEEDVKKVDEENDMANPKDRGLSCFEEKKQTMDDINGDNLGDESVVKATDRGLFGQFTGKKEEDVKKVDEENETANPNDHGLFGFEEKKPTVDDINSDNLGDESVVKATDRGLFGQFTGKKEEGVKKVDEENETANPNDHSLFGFEEKKPTVDDINSDNLGDESVVKATEGGLFGQFTGKKEEGVKKVDEENGVAEEFEKGSMLKPEEEEKKEEDKEEKMLQRSGSSSSSSSSDEEETGADGEKKKKKKKGLMEKIKEMVSGGDKENEKVENTENNMLEKEVEAPYEKPIGETYYETAADQAEEKKGFMDKTTNTEDASPKIDTQEPEQKEKKGVFEKIKEKIPGYNTKATQS